MLDPFNTISESEKIEILNHLEAVRFTLEKGKSLLSKVNQQKLLGIVLSGSLDVIYTDHNGSGYITDHYDQNDVVGLAVSKYNAKELDIIATTPCEVVIFDELSLFKIFSYSPHHQQFLSNLLQIVFERMKTYQQHLEILHQKTIRNRLLMYFSQHNVNQTVRLPYSYTRLADYLAVDRCAMMRELKYLKEEHLIETKGRKITLYMIQSS